ncbi:MAG: hypothetical protein ACRDRG_18855 [Pseudonocardiaceae bacterium]
MARARLVAGLRALGMPLARIRTVCDLPDNVSCVIADVVARS